MGHCCYQHDSEEKYFQYRFGETIVLPHTYIKSNSPSIHSTTATYDLLEIKELNFSHNVLRDLLPQNEREFSSAACKRK